MSAGRTSLTTLLHPVTGQERIWAVQAKDARSLTPALSQRERETVGAGNLPVMQMIRPSVRDRWMATSLRNYTPERVEQICRGAMAGDLTAQWEMFDLMEQTWPRLSKNLNQLKDAVVGMEWNVQAWAPKNGKPSAEAQKRADFIEELLWDFEAREEANENDFEGTIRDLLDAKGKGIVALEIDWTIGQTTFGPAIKPRATRWVHPRHYGYPGTTGAPDELMLDTREMAVDGNQNLLTSIPTSVDRFAPFPKNKFILGIWKQKSGHPISGAMLRILGFWWAGANFAGEWFLNYAQIFGMPMRWATYDPGLPQRDKDLLEEMLANMGSAGYAMFPAGVTMELKEAAKGASENPHLSVLNFADTLCDILILRQTLTTDTGAKGSGSKALGVVHEGVLGQVIIGAGDWAAAKLQAQLIRPICLLNFGDTRECPFLSPALVEEQDELAMADRDTKLASIMPIPAEYLYNRHKIPMPADGDRVIGGQVQTADDADDADSKGKGGKEVKAKDRSLTPALSQGEREMHAHDDATDKLIESVSGVEARWLGGLRPYYRELIALAESATDEKDLTEKLETVLAKSTERYPELFAKMDVAFLADRIEGVLGAACVNGAIEGAMKRRRISNFKFQISDSGGNS